MQARPASSGTPRRRAQYPYPDYRYEDLGPFRLEVLVVELLTGSVPSEAVCGRLLEEPSPDETLQSGYELSRVGADEPGRLVFEDVIAPNPALSPIYVEISSCRTDALLSAYTEVWLDFATREGDSVTTRAFALSPRSLGLMETGVWSLQRDPCSLWSKGLVAGVVLDADLDPVAGAAVDCPSPAEEGSAEVYYHDDDPSDGSFATHGAPNVQTMESGRAAFLLYGAPCSVLWVHSRLDDAFADELETRRYPGEARILTFVRNTSR